MTRIPLSEPSFGVEEESLLLEAVRSGYVSSVGPLVRDFEDEFAASVGSRYAVACSSGTAALHLALLAVGATAGADVLVSDLTFIASANPVRYCGAEPVLVDSEVETWNLDPMLVIDELRRRAAAGERQPAAVVVVHLLGQPARLEALLEACEEAGVPVVEDAAESLGAAWTAGPLASRQVGTVGRVGCFSFNGNKVITAGGGGMVVTDDEALATQVRHLSTQARLPGAFYRHDQVGYNYRLTNVAAAVGLAQLRRLGTYLTGRREVAARYDSELARLDGVELPPNVHWADRSAWLYTVLLPDPGVREQVRLDLDSAGVEARPIWPAIRSQVPYSSARVLGGAVATALADRGLSLPSSPHLSAAAQARVVEELTRAVGRRVS